jgi:hypothetical protein
MTESILEGLDFFPLDPETVISALSLNLKTPTPPNSRPNTSQPWDSQTPNNPVEASS